MSSNDNQIMTNASGKDCMDVALQSSRHTSVSENDVGNAVHTRIDSSVEPTQHDALCGRGYAVFLSPRKCAVSQACETAFDEIRSRLKRRQTACAIWSR
jgi:hypothetical protein